MKTTCFVLTILISCGISLCAQEKIDFKNAKVSQYFKGQKNGITYYGDKFEYNWEFIKYDGRKIEKWIGGDSGKNPNYVVKSLVFKLNGKNYSIPTKDYEDLYDPQVQGSQGYIMANEKFIFLTLPLSDGAGAARVTFIFAKDQYLERKVETYWDMQR